MNYKNKNISFPLGGIGAGCIGLSGNGELIDWEIFNKPNKNTRNGYSHFAIVAKTGDKSDVRVLQGDTSESLMGRHVDGMYSGFGFGPASNSFAGFPHFRNAEFSATLPMSELVLSDTDFPCKARLKAFNPLIPHDEFNSSLPAAFFEWTIENTGDSETEYTVALTVENPCAHSVNKAFSCDGKSGVVLINNEKKIDEIGYFDMTVMTDSPNAITQEYWYRGGWQDPVTMYWNEMQGNGLSKRHYDTEGYYDRATVSACASLKAGEKRSFRFVISWYVPNQYNYWNPFKDEDGNDVTWKNYYATEFDSSHEVAKYAISSFDALKEKTERFVSSFEKSSLPSVVIDAICSNLSVLKSPTVLRLQDGSLWGWEGCHENQGSCDGSCQHVWNYAYALPFLFPRLERSLRENTVKYGLNDSGATTFRIPLPLGRKPDKAVPLSCVDGQMGEVIKIYREWRISGDAEWLRQNGEAALSMLEYAWSSENPHKWDENMDGVLEGKQHHTLDMELFGPSSWLQGFYLLALDCGAKIARELGQNTRAELYEGLYQNGKKWTNENLFNGEYFYHKVDLNDKSLAEKFDSSYYWNEETSELKYQVANGCIIDQMLSDFHSAIIGLDGIFDEQKKQTALSSLYRYNFKPSMRDVTNMWRNFAINDESATVICTYPYGKPSIPIPYCEEAMTGFEYALAVLMLANGREKECLAMVKAIRDRYDGEKRNPFNEIECGSNYARSMASYALLPIYSGFTFDIPSDYVGFKPLVKGNCSFPWSVAEAYGSVTLDSCRELIEVYAGELEISRLGLRDNTRVKTVKVDGEIIVFTQQNDVLSIKKTVLKHSLELEFEQ